MEHDTIETLRERHPAWSLLRSVNVPLVLSFLGGHFVEHNHGATSRTDLVAALDEALHALNQGADEPRYPRAAEDYLEDWADDSRQWLRRFYLPGSDDLHYDATPALEKAYAWVSGLQSRSFVGTESRLQTAVDLLRQIVLGTESDPDTRLAELRRRREALDAEITAAEAGEVVLLDETGLRDRYQQFSRTARELLADFREVEENFRTLDRSARERIAGWSGSKGELLADLVANRSDIGTSDQGRSFQAFYDFLLSAARQEELADLLDRVQRVDVLEPDRRLRTVHHDWSDAAERTQRTVRQISEQLRRFLDDQVWVENRRVLDLVRAVETAALRCRDNPPAVGLEVDEPGVGISLPFERPLYDAQPLSAVESLLDPDAESEVDVAALLNQRHVDTARLAGQIRSVVPVRGSALLADVLDLYPLSQGVAELVAYLALNDEDLAVEMDESAEMVLDVTTEDGERRRVRMPVVTVTRR